MISPVNIGCGAGRRLLAQEVNSPFTMMLDDDIYLTSGAIDHAMEVFRENLKIGAVGLPLYDLNGRLMSPGGRRLIIRNGVIIQGEPRLDLHADWIDVDDVAGGAMIYRTEMRHDFLWDDRYFGAFDDLDKSLQILKAGRWRQVIVPKARLIHDRSWLGHNPTYERERFDGLAWRRSYRAFREKWGLRLELRSHLLFELVFPALALTRCQQLVSALNKLNEMRSIRELYRRNMGIAN